MFICAVFYTDLYVAPMAKTLMYWVRVPAGSDVCQISCAYTLLQFVQMTRVCNVINSRHTVDCKEPLKSFNKSREEFRLRIFFCRDIAMIVQKST